MASRAVALNRRASLWFEDKPQVMAQQDELIRARFRRPGRARGPRRAGRLGGQPTPTPQPDHSARSVSAAHLPRNPDRHLRMTRKPWRSRFRNAVCSRRRAQYHRASLLLHAAATRGIDGSTGRVGAAYRRLSRRAPRSCDQRSKARCSPPKSIGPSSVSSGASRIATSPGRGQHGGRRDVSEGKTTSSDSDARSRTSLVDQPLQSPDPPLQFAPGLQQLDGQRGTGHIHTQVAHQPARNPQPRQRAPPAPATGPA